MTSRSPSAESMGMSAAPIAVGPGLQEAAPKESLTFTDRLNSIIHSDTAKKVSSYIFQAGSFIGTIPLYGIAKLKDFYLGLADRINTLTNNIPVVIISTIALLYLFPRTTLIGGAIGFATTKRFNILETIICAPKLSTFTLMAIGSLAAVAMPAGALSTLAISAGAIGLGRAVNQAYQSCRSRIQKYT